MGHSSSHGWQIGRLVRGPLAGALLMGLVYFASAQVGLAFFVVQPAALATVWPASGVLLAGLLLVRRSRWPWLLLGAGGANVLANLIAEHPLPVAIAFALANLAEALLSASLVRRWSPGPLVMDRLRDVTGLIGLTAVAGNAATALLGAAVVRLSFGAPFWESWRVWFVADGLGMLLITPLALCWLAPGCGRQGRPALGRLAEAGALGAALILVGGVVFDGLGGSRFTLPYPLFPLLVWAALRFHMRGATLASLLLAALATLGTTVGRGPFVAATDSQLGAILEAQQYLAILVPCAYVTAALIAERTASQAALARANTMLEGQVAARTAELVGLNRQLTVEVAERTTAEQEAHASEERFRLLVEGVQDYAIYLLDPAGNVSSWNSGAQRLKGYRADEILGRHVSAFYTPEERLAGRARQLLARAADTGHVEDEGWRVRKDGARFWAHVVISALRDSGGELRGFAKITHDDTERRRQAETLRASEAELAAIITSAMDAIITIDEEQRITRFNPAAEQLFGCSAAEVLGEPLDRFVPPEYRSRHAEHIRRFGETNITNRAMGQLTPVRGIRADGSSVPVEAAISQVRLPTHRLYTVILRDISVRVAAEATLQRSRQELERQVAERTAVLTAALAEKETLLKEVHHRVKNNLQVISSLLWLQTRRLRDPAGIAALQESRQRVETMTLVHELLYRDGDLARIEAATYLRELTGHLLQLFGPDQGQVTLEVQASGTLELEHAVPCGLILTEAISNSLKYAFPAGRRGRITVALEQPQAGTLRLLVADDGIGLPDSEALAHGRSLGMRLITNLARQLRGNLSVTSDEGVQISITFPAPRATTAAT